MSSGRVDLNAKSIKELGSTEWSERRDRLVGCINDEKASKKARKN